MKAKTMQTLAKLRNAFMPVQTNKPLSFPWGRVGTTAPLTVSLPLSADPVPVTSSAVPADLLRAGDKVLCAWYGDELVVVEAPAVATRQASADAAVAGWAGNRLPLSTDFNNYIVPGHWYSPNNTDVATMANRPPSGLAGALVILASAGTQQFWHEYNSGRLDGRMWRRRLYGGSWSPWTTKDLNMGTVSLGQYSGSNAMVTATVNHGIAGTPSAILTTINHAAAGSASLVARAYNKTSTQFTCIFMNTNSTSLNGQWLAADWVAFP